MEEKQQASDGGIEGTILPPFSHTLARSFLNKSYLESLLCGKQGQVIILFHVKQSMLSFPKKEEWLIVLRDSSDY